MRTSITHLPEQVRTDLDYITDFLVKNTKTRLERTGRRQTNSCIRYLLLHGCFTERDWKRDTELRSDEIFYSYNIMVVISAHLFDILNNLEKVVEQLNQSGKVSFPVITQVVDTKGRIDQRLRNGYLAYDQVQTRSIQLYSKGDTSHDLFTMPDLPPVQEHTVRARRYFDQAYPLAELFLSGARSFEDKDRNAAAFMLNLSAAQAYEAMMVVHTLKYPLGRPLNNMRELAESLHPELAMVWTGLQGEQIFDHLSAAYRDVRFSAYYHVTDSALNSMFAYVEDLQRLVHHICQIKFEALKAGSLAKPQKDWLKVVGQALKPPEEDDDEDDDEPEVLQNTAPTPSPIFRTPEQEEALKKLRSKIFDIEEPCYDLEQLGCALSSMAYQDVDAELSGFPIMGRVVRERALMLKDTFTQMVDLLKQTRFRGDMPAKSDAANG